MTGLQQTGTRGWGPSRVHACVTLHCVTLHCVTHSWQVLPFVSVAGRPPCVRESVCSATGFSWVRVMVTFAYAKVTVTGLVCPSP